MPTAILLPSAQGDQNNWTLGAGASKPVAVSPGDPVSHDDDTTYVTINLSAALDSYQLSGIPPLGQVNGFSVGMRGRHVGSGDNLVGGVRFDTTNGGSVGGATSVTYTTFGPSPVARPGGGSYTPSDFVNGSNATQLFIQQAGGTEMRVTSVWGVLDYEPPSGGFAFLLSLGPILGLLGAGLTFGEFRAALALSPRLRFTEYEKRTLWDELRAYRHPRFFFPAVA